MNKVLVGINIVLIAAVGYLFYKVNGMNNGGKEEAEQKTEDKKEAKAASPVVEQKGSTPTGKIAFVNIDKLNEQSLEIADLESELKKRRMSIEASMESLNMEYQKKVEEYQNSAKAGIAPAAELESKAKYIQSLQKQAENKQLQMDNLTSDFSERNMTFQKNVKNFLQKWNSGRYDYVLSYSEALPTMLLGNTTLEVTAEVIEGLNRDYKESKPKK